MGLIFGEEYNHEYYHYAVFSSPLRRSKRETQKYLEKWSERSAFLYATVRRS
jgi:hypothetical protein